MLANLFTQPLDASYVIAFLLVVFYAGSRFKTPKTVRSQTSRAQFWLSACAYVISCTGIFMLLTWGITRNVGLIQALHFGAADHSNNDIANLDAALVAALMLTTLLPSFPVLRDIDSGILRFFHRMGSIPFGAQLLARKMVESRFTVPPDAPEAMRQYILNSPQLPYTLTDDLRLDADADPVRFPFTRNLAIYVALSSLKDRALFADEYPEDVAGFEKTMSSYVAQCASFLAVTAKLSSEDLREVSDSIKKFRALNLDAYEQLRIMLARVMLYNCRGETEIIQRLNRIGFALDRQRPIVVPHNLLAFDMIGVIVLFTAATLIQSTVFQSGEISVSKALAIALLVAVNDSIAAVFALLVKEMWSFADIRTACERPYLGYVVSAAIALTISIPVSFAFYEFRLHFMADGHRILPFFAQCKWLLTSTTLALALAYACDDHIVPEQEPPWLRWAEGAGIGALMGAVGWLVVLWLADDRNQLHPGGATAHLWTPIMLNAAIGALFGSTVPHWYRSKARQVATPSVAAPLANALIGAV